MNLRRILTSALCSGLLVVLACGESDPTSGTGTARKAAPAGDARGKPAPEPEIYRSEVDEGIGSAVMILVDTSGSMKDAVPGGSRPKYTVARTAIEKMLEATDKFVAAHPERPIRVGLLHFSDRPVQVLDIADYATPRFLEALARIPLPEGNTAIGESLDAARRALYRSGCLRKYILVVTDGENTAGRKPEPVAREIYRRSEGAVQIYFVAFDTDPAKFSFLKEVGGDVVSAQSEEQLGSALADIYEGKILAEAMTDVETPVR